MNGIIVVFPKIEDGKSVRNLLVRHGYEVTAVCTQGAQVLNYIDTMNDGIIISGYRFADMYYFDLKHSLTPGFDMLLMASQRVCGECMDHEIVCVTMPLKVQDLISTVEMMCMNQARRRKKLRSRPKQRTEEEKKDLNRRLKIIAGQVNGISQMIEDDRYCNDVLIQISSTINALKSLGTEMLKSHLRTCVVKDIKDNKLEVLDGVVDLFGKIK